MIWNLTYTTKRPDRLYEACYQEPDGLFTIGVAATEQSAQADAMRKIRETDGFASFT